MPNTPNVSNKEASFHLKSVFSVLYNNHMICLSSFLIIWYVLQGMAKFTNGVEPLFIGLFTSLCSVAFFPLQVIYLTGHQSNGTTKPAHVHLLLSILMLSLLKPNNRLCYALDNPSQIIQHCPITHLLHRATSLAQCNIPIPGIKF